MSIRKQALWAGTATAVLAIAAVGLVSMSNHTASAETLSPEEISAIKAVLDKPNDQLSDRLAAMDTDMRAAFIAALTDNASTEATTAALVKLTGTKADLAKLVQTSLDALESDPRLDAVVGGAPSPKTVPGGLKDGNVTPSPKVSEVVATIEDGLTNCETDPTSDKCVATLNPAAAGPQTAFNFVNSFFGPPVNAGTANSLR